VVYVPDAGLRRAHQRNGVMDRIDAHPRNIADAVADAGIADLSPEPLVAGGSVELRPIWLKPVIPAASGAKQSLGLAVRPNFFAGWT
jgi:hypothetical protein